MEPEWRELHRLSKRFAELEEELDILPLVLDDIWDAICDLRKRIEELEERVEELEARLDGA